MRRYFVPVTILISLTLSSALASVSEYGERPTGPADPIAGCEYFEATQHNLCDPFLSYWRDNGGLSVFGYPATEAQDELNPDLNQTFLTQYFERERMEHHPDNAGTPYEILLGRLGHEVLTLQGRDWSTFPKADQSTDHYFAETGHAIAPQFWDYWSSHGLEFGDEGVTSRESLALFGLPLSEPAMETNASGDLVLTQWFERARFEYHPDNSPEFQVLLGLLGNEFLAADPGSEPEPPTPEPPTPEPPANVITFGDGIWEVGKDFPPGTYRAPNAVGDECYWARLSKIEIDEYDGQPTLDSIIENNRAGGPEILTIQATDVGFESRDCGGWTSDLSPVAGAPLDPFPSGTWQVGVDIAPGTYRTTVDVDWCSWYRTRDFTHEYPEGVITSSTTSGGSQVITISPDDVGFNSTEECSSWTSDLSSIRPDPTGALTNGIWIVNTDMAPGVWANVATDDFCHWARLKSFTGDLDVDAVENEYGYDYETQLVTIYPTDAGFLADDGCGVWIYVSP